MHVPDHLVTNPVEFAALVSATGVIAAVALETGRGARTPAAPPTSARPTLLRSPERAGPQLATAALVFALQMVNFPVLPGTSGHLLGGALATALIGPRRALIALTAVVITQSLVFADGGVGALGVNLWLIAIVPVGVAAAVRSRFGDDRGRASRRWGSIGLAAVLGPPMASLAFVALYWAGGTSPVGLGELLGSMVGVHLLIGIGEAAVTLGVLAVVATTGSRAGAGTAPVWLTAIGSAMVLSLMASTRPDGLERVGADLGFALTGPGSILSASPLADYQLSLFGGTASAALAGLAGVIATCAICAALTALAGSNDGERRAALTP